jgi:alkanesulfonate monooxygenase SsuD/methylene tetrahydromethanopterin reductase-like flavin-dependent oxidoreductase (luciferase family)
MRFAISIPQFVADGAFDPAGLRAYLARAEALGFDSAWTMEQVLGTMPTQAGSSRARRTSTPLAATSPTPSLRTF